MTALRLLLGLLVPTAPAALAAVPGPRPAPVPVPATGPAAARPTPVPTPASVQERIDLLLKRRLQPEALPVTPPNPFQVVAGGIRLVTAEDVAHRTATVDLNGPAAVSVTSVPAGVVPGPPAGPAPGIAAADVLSITAARLKIGGIIMLKEQIQIVINGTPRREGDAVPAEWNNAVIYLRIVRLRPAEVVLRYGDAEATVRF